MTYAAAGVDIDTARERAITPFLTASRRRWQPACDRAAGYATGTTAAEPAR